MCIRLNEVLDIMKLPFFRYEISTTSVTYRNLGRNSYPDLPRVPYSRKLQNKFEEHFPDIARLTEKTIKVSRVKRNGKLVLIRKLKFVLPSEK